MTRRLPRAAAAALALAATTVSAALTQPITQGSITVKLKLLATSNSGALDMAHANDGSGRLFVASQGGKVRLIKENALQTAPFLDVALALPGFSSGGEKGLLGVAFHPDFAAPSGTPGAGKFYTYTSENKIASPDFSHPQLNLGNTDHDSVIREWSVSGANSDLIDASASRIVMRIAQPQSNHNGGAIKFGADDLLYIAMGDGGGGNDAGTGHTPVIGNGQDTSNVYGDILRIDPLPPSLTPGTIGAPSANGQYRVPVGNPFVSAAGPQPNSVKEIFAYGFRNPFRMGFDRKTGKLYLGDVGQSQREEVDIVENGKNYGWVYKEGSVTLISGGPADTVLPIAEYDNNTDGQAIIGGFVYRGFRLPELHGKYVFGDFVGNAGRGRIFYTEATGGTIFEMKYDAAGAAIGSLLYGFGEGPTGEIYGLFNNGQVLQLAGGPVQWEVNGPGNYHTAANWSNNVVPNATGDVANLMGALIVPNNAPAVVTLTNTVRLGTLRFFNDALNPNGASPYTYILEAPQSFGLEIQTKNNNTDPALIAADAGHHLVNTAVGIFANTQLRAAENSSLTFAHPFNNNNGKGITKTGAGTVNFDGGLFTGSFTSLDIQQGTVTASRVSSQTISLQTGTRLIAGEIANTFTTLSIAAGATATLTPRVAAFPSSVQSLSIAGGASPVGTFDLNQRFRVLNPDLLTLAAQIRFARNAGLYNQPGITSETARNSGFTKTIGLLPDGTMDVAFFGDSDLDGDLDADDYHRLDVGFLERLAGWHNGDADHSGGVNVDDYALVDFAYRSINPIAAAAMIDKHTQEFGASYTNALAAIPEPGSGILVGLLASLLLTRRRVAVPLSL